MTSLVHTLSTALLTLLSSGSSIYTSPASGTLSSNSYLVISAGSICLTAHLNSRSPDLENLSETSLA
jgi:hypothetical protein